MHLFLKLWTQVRSRCENAEPPRPRPRSANRHWGEWRTFRGEGSPFFLLYHWYQRDTLTHASLADKVRGTHSRACDYEKTEVSVFQGWIHQAMPITEVFQRLQQVQQWLWQTVQDGLCCPTMARKQEKFVPPCAQPSHKTAKSAAALKALVPVAPPKPKRKHKKKMMKISL